MTVLPGFDPETFMETIETPPHHGDDAGADDALRAARPPEVRPVRPVEPADRVLRRLARELPPAWPRPCGKLGPIFFQFYGQAEAPEAITSLRKEDHDPEDLDRLARCGRPVPWVHVALLDDDGNEVPTANQARSACRARW